MKKGLEHTIVNTSATSTNSTTAPTNVRRALYIGRFQLFHLGHLDVVKYIDNQKDVDELVFAIGSSQFDYLHKSPKWPWANNPFTYEERTQILQKSLENEIKKPYTIYPVPDYFDYDKWYNHIKEQLPSFAYLYTSDKTEKEYFESKGHEVRSFPRMREYHAQILRERMYKGMEYQSALTKGTLDMVTAVHAEERIKELFAKDIALRLQTAGLQTVNQQNGSQPELYRRGNVSAMPQGLHIDDDSDTQEPESDQRRNFNAIL